ncbi:cytochrome P450 [Mytilinidion resinicola]|uniref:Cytochrome P450 n=1 Tax=Mytilinidion resinicola TaxID=574789 RepID=A0A6A6YBF4_9PEZI|nr:cytochrome P450 [Mytilinidion resinicola]KAF2805344.1 cytochrome P450 [Mytilinidion resinicola]
MSESIVAVTTSQFTENPASCNCPSPVPVGKTVYYTLVFGGIFSIPLCFNYAFAWTMYHWQHLRVHERQIPPVYPSFLPYLGSVIELAINGQTYLKRATSYAGEMAAARMTILGKEIYFFQDRESVAAMWKQQLLSSPVEAYIYSLSYIFGMKETALATYRADDSGPFRKPYPGSNVRSQDRVDHITHSGLLKALTGSGLAPTAQQFMESFLERLDNLPADENWTDMPDLLKFFQDVVGTASMQAVAGPTLLKLNPTFVDDFWSYDKYVPWFARGVPSFIMLGAVKNRGNLINQIKSWYAYARQHFDESSISKDGDGDPFWGSELMRGRQKTLLLARNQDDDSLASADLGLIWASVSNSTPTAMFATMHMFKEPGLVARVRKSVDSQRDSNNPSALDVERLLQNPLLSSIYAETLRMYVKSYFVASSPHADVALGRGWLPKGEIALVNSGIAHMDARVWNTKSGVYPVDSFWADRFITDPRDPSSGPVKPGVERQARGEPTAEKTEPYFSLDGLEGSWIPYGGGHAICPGRFLTKNLILLSSAVIADRFDIQILGGHLKLSSAKFGLGSLRPKEAIPFRIKRRVTD